MEWDGLFVVTHRDVYEPHDDSFLLARVVAETVGAGVRFLEVGCGAGLVSMAAARAGATVTATDINPFAVRLAAQNAKQNKFVVAAINADLMAGLTGPFDVIAFNPPYLPTAPEDKVDGPLNAAFDGGLSGNDVVLRLVDQLAAAPWQAQQILIIHSSLSDPAPLKAAMADAGYGRHAVVADEKHFMERLTVRSFKPS